MKKLDLSKAMNRSDPLSSAVAHEINRIVYPTATMLAANDEIKAHDSLGWAIANPAYQNDYSKVWNDPDKLIWLAGGFGMRQPGFSANGACKIRPAARLDMDSLGIKHKDANLFLDKVDKQSDKSLHDLKFGDFPHGGAVFVEMCGLRLLVAVSCLREDEDGILAAMVGATAAQALHRSNQLHLIAA